MPISILAPPAQEPVTLVETKQFLRVEHADDDGLILGVIAAARALVEAKTSRCLVTRTLRETLDDWRIDARGGVLLSPSPLSGIAAVRLIAPNGSAFEVDPEQYRLDSGVEEARLIFASVPPAPLRPVGGLEVDIVAGYGEAASVPPGLRHAVLHTALALYDGRGELELLPPLAQALCAPFARLRL